MDRKQVYELIDGERDYQDSLGPDRVQFEVETVGPSAVHRKHSVGDYLVMLQVYVNRANEAWVNNPGDEMALDVMRKCAGIAVHCMEDHGAPGRQPSRK